MPFKGLPFQSSVGWMPFHIALKAPCQHIKDLSPSICCSGCLGPCCKAKRAVNHMALFQASPFCLLALFQASFFALASYPSLLFGFVPSLLACLLIINVVRQPPNEKISNESVLNSTPSPCSQSGIVFSFCFFHSCG